MWDPCGFSCITFILAVAAMEISRRKMKDLSDSVISRRTSSLRDRQDMTDTAHQLMEEIKQLHGRTCVLEQQQTK